MKAVRFLGHGRATVVETPCPQPRRGEVLVKILASAVCGSERKDWAGEIDRDQMFISGHEAVGEIVEVNETRQRQIGERVCVQIMHGCGHCYYCQKGLPTFCPDLQYEGACHAQYAALPESCVVPIDGDISPDVAVLLGGDLLGVAWRATRQLPIKPEAWVFVSGGGPIGLGMTRMLKALGARVALSEPSDFRRGFAKAYAGADLALNPVEEDVHAALLEITEGIGPEITIECSGHPVAQGQALDWTRCQGHVMFCGENYRGLNIIPSLQIIHKELNVHGAFYFAPADVPEIVRLYRNGMNPEGLISHRVGIEEAPEAMRAFFEGQTGKVIILPHGREVLKGE